ncbi:DUF1707 domain-containing protein [Micromonospora sp. CPCC 205711]|uniref:DUF1707 SHOCT-like domain-containing protein n=1 Tax=Micromonospora sp. CPCC 205547 TaxID=3122400 RepID=UPI002FF07CF0
MEARDRMRAGDADRQAVAEQLRVAVDEGRLDLHEYDERLRLAYEAKTYGELDAVVGDLPAPASAERSALAPRQTGPGGLDTSGPDTGGPVPAAPLEAAAASGTAGADRPVAGDPRGWLTEVWAPWLRVAAILAAIWLIGAVGRREIGFFWPVWVLGPWGALLLLRTAGGLASGDSRRDAGGRARGAVARRRTVGRDARRRARRKRRTGGW